MENYEIRENYEDMEVTDEAECTDVVAAEDNSGNDFVKGVVTGGVVVLVGGKLVKVAYKKVVKPVFSWIKGKFTKSKEPIEVECEEIDCEEA